MQNEFNLKNGKTYQIEISDIQKQNNNQFVVLKATINNQAIGYLRGTLNFKSSTAECNAATEMAFRNNGIAANLLDSFLQLVFENEKFEKIEQVILSINNENRPSRRVAEKLGFSLTGTDSRDSVEYVMTKELYNEQQHNKVIK